MHASRAGGMEAKVTESEPSDNRSARLDIYTPGTVARITCWESGDYYAEAIDLKTGQSIFSRHGEIHAEVPIPIELAEFFKSLAGTDLLKTF